MKKIMKTMDISKDRYNPLTAKAKIGNVKNELIDPEEYLDKTALDIFKKYEAALVKNNALDFDDLIEKVVWIFKNHPKVLEKYQKRFRYILVDEYQDVNPAQYQLIKLLSKGSQNLTVVGDDAQCVLPETQIATDGGLKMIKNISLKNRVIAAAGDEKICFANIDKIKKFRYRGALIKITTTDKKTLKLTPNHIIFTKTQLLDDIFYVYLMYRKDKGFRIGLTKGSRWSRDKRQLGLMVRTNQERADKMWILKVCFSRAEAEYYEYYYAFNYGLPTLVFDTNNRDMLIPQSHVDKLFDAIDTKSRVRKLMKDELLYFSYPHWLPKGTIRHSSRRLRIRLTLFDDRRKSLAHPWGMSRISVNTKDSALKTAIEKLGFTTRKGKITDWRLEIARLNYSEIEKIAERLMTASSEVEIVRSACLTKGKRLFFQPASHVRPTMQIAVKNGKKVIEKTVKKVEVEQYDGYVYDLDVKNVHNYVANDFVVHNSIYGFRGSDFRNFLNFEKDWPNAKVVLLEQNYRSTSNIINAASTVIKNNKFQKPKELWTKNPSGDLIQVAACEDAEQEADFIADKIRQLMSRANATVNEFDGRENSSTPQLINSSTAILYRTNAQSRAIEQTLIIANIPYKIFGGLKFYERKEIKDIVAALRIAANPKDEVSRERIVKNFTKSVTELLLEELPRLGKNLKILELISWFLNNADYFDYLEKNYKNYQERKENINELIVFASGFENLGEFLERVSLLQSADQPANQLKSHADATVNEFRTEKNSSTHQLINSSTISLMTIHLAKGLEFETVFVAGCNEGTLPHQMSYGSLDDTEEERRLMYVAMTRARKNLFLSFYNLPSRFLGEIPPELTEVKQIGRPKYQESEEDIYIEESEI